MKMTVPALAEKFDLLICRPSTQTPLPRQASRLGHDGRHAVRQSRSAMLNDDEDARLTPRATGPAPCATDASPAFCGV